MKNLTIEELEEKYGNIEDKVPSVFKDYNEVSIKMQQDLCCTWDIRNAELYRVISLVGIRTHSGILNKHLDLRFSYIGLYPEIMKPFNILPEKYNKELADKITKDGQKLIRDMLNVIIDNRQKYKSIINEIRN